jgi:arabinan endo-1,5-alpha-L-arabinosidase
MLRGTTDIHDPSTIVRCGKSYWVFGTGQGIFSRHSTDLVTWRAGPRVFDQIPLWAAEIAPRNFGVFWAPEVIKLNDRYLLYYAVSTWGSRESAIALASTRTLDPGAPGFGWRDDGLVLRTSGRDEYNAIDPSVMLDHDGRLWLAFGSYWSGIKLVELDPATGKRLQPDSPMYSLAWHESIEAACLHRHGDFYYLFVNWGQCCRGTNSTYEIRVGRSRNVTGPYLDRAGTDMLHDGGTLFLANRARGIIGPGHAGIVHARGRDFVSFHHYDAANGGRGTLGIAPLNWTRDGWPEVPRTYELNPFGRTR